MVRFYLKCNSFLDLIHQIHYKWLRSIHHNLPISKMYWLNPFRIFKTFLLLQVNHLYEELVDEEGKIKTKSGYFEIHQGLTQKPLTSDQTNITITHSYINSTLFLKVLYHCHIDYQQWIEICKSKILETIHQEIELYLDKSQYSWWERQDFNSWTTRKQFFSEEVIEAIEKLADQKHKDNLLHH